MPSTLRLDATHYKSDLLTLSKIINTARASNPPIPELDIDVTTQSPLKTMTVRINTKSLYLLGFQGDNGKWFFFNGLGSGGITLVADGSYNSLGIGQNSTFVANDIMYATKLSEKTDGTGLTAKQKSYLFHLIVAISEALRFHHVFWSVLQTIKKSEAGTPTPYIFHWNTVHNWGQMSAPTHSKHRAVRTLKI